MATQRHVREPARRRHPYAVGGMFGCRMVLSGAADMVRTVLVGTVLSLARYPVKSMGGESLERVAMTPRGLAADRAWAVYTADGGIGSGNHPTLPSG